MSEIRAGEYVRTKKGEIHKVIAVEMRKDPEDWNYYKYENDMGDFEMFIAKHSPNLIELIEVGDYVNKYRVESTNGNGIYDNLIGFGNGRLRNITAEEIRTIVTKEQFNSIKYEVN